jgi:CTP synthase
MTGFIIVTGGMSGLGKGVVTSSIGKTVQARGYKVTPIKFDGYLNVDAGTMNPYRHGEVYVLDDGTECDMDLGMYERFLGAKMGRMNNPTSGKIFELVLQKERKGEYLGVDVQFIPHVTGEIKDWVRKTARDADVAVVEVGGTVGDIENSYFIEAMRQLKIEEGNVVFVHVVLVPKLKVVGEQKTKLAQQSVKQLLSMGVQPDFVVSRCEEPLSNEARQKIALFCNVHADNVVSCHDNRSIYEVPFMLERQKMAERILSRLGLESRHASLLDWQGFVDGILNPDREVTVAITGKYTALKDSYISILESLVHAGAHHRVRVSLKWVETTEIEEGRVSVEDALAGVDGVIVPGGFGSRGTEGKMACIRHCRENNVPYLGLCYGFQMAVVEFARNACGLANANSTEIDPKTPHPVIDILPGQTGMLGGTMRLGSWEALLASGSKVENLYGKQRIAERHRHRYEVNPNYVAILEKHGLLFSGRTADGRLMEFLEIPNHAFFVGTQAHPEFKSRLEEPAPLFRGFVEACLHRNGGKAEVRLPAQA